MVNRGEDRQAQPGENLKPDSQRCQVYFVPQEIRENITTGAEHCKKLQKMITDSLDEIAILQKESYLQYFYLKVGGVSPPPVKIRFTPTLSS